MSELLLILIITLVVWSFVLYFIIRNAIDNSTKIKRMETLLEEIATNVKKER